MGRRNIVFARKDFLLQGTHRGPIQTQEEDSMVALNFGYFEIVGLIYEFFILKSLFSE